MASPLQMFCSSVVVVVQVTTVAVVVQVVDSRPTPMLRCPELSTCLLDLAVQLAPAIRTTARTVQHQRLARYPSTVEMVDVRTAVLVVHLFHHRVLAETEAPAARLLVPLAVLGRHQELLVRWSCIQAAEVAAAGLLVRPVAPVAPVVVELAVD